MQKDPSQRFISVQFFICEIFFIRIYILKDLKIEAEILNPLKIYKYNTIICF